MVFLTDGLANGSFSRARAEDKNEDKVKDPPFFSGTLTAATTKLLRKKPVAAVKNPNGGSVKRL